MQKENIIIIVAVILAAVIIGGYFLFPNQIQQLVSQTQKTEGVSQSVNLVIDFGDGTETMDLGFVSGMTAFDALNAGVKEADLTLETKTYEGMGIFVEQIGTKKNGDNNKYWLYYINSEMPMVSADNLELSAGDKIEFKFEASSF